MTLIDVCATGDGTTDDSAAFQAAVDALQHIKGEIRLPSAQGPSQQAKPSASGQTPRPI